MWGKLEDTVKNQSTTLEETIAPVPAIVFDHVMRFSFDPEIKRN